MPEVTWAKAILDSFNENVLKQINPKLKFTIEYNGNVYNAEIVDTPYENLYIDASNRLEGYYLVYDKFVYFDDWQSVDIEVNNFYIDTGIYADLTKDKNIEKSLNTNIYKYCDDYDYDDFGIPNKIEISYRHIYEATDVDDKIRKLYKKFKNIRKLNHRNLEEEGVLYKRVLIVKNYINNYLGKHLVNFYPNYVDNKNRYFATLKISI